MMCWGRNYRRLPSPEALEKRLQHCDFDGMVAARIR